MSKGRRFNFSKKKDFSNEDSKKVKIGILSENVMSYYRNVSTSLENGFDDDPEMKENFLTNVYSTLKDEGIQVSQNQTVSRILETLFTHSRPCHMTELFCSFCSNLTVVMFDRFASHVFQSLIQHLSAMYEGGDDGKHGEGPGKSGLRASIGQLCKFTESHLRDIMTHTYASHVLRSLFEALGGAKVSEEVIRSRASRVHCKEKPDTLVTVSCKSLSQDFQESFKALKEKLVRLCDFEDHLRDPSYCPVLQTLLLILHKTSPEEYKSLVKTILEKTFVVPDTSDSEDVSKRLPDIVQNEVGSYLIELVISLATKDELSELHGQIFKGNLIYFAVHPIANYVLQKFLSVVVDPLVVKELLADITQYLEDILAVNHIGIVTKLAQACRNARAGQADFIKALMTAFHCIEPAERQVNMVPLIASLQTYEVFFHVDEADKEAGKKSPSSLLKAVNIHGSLLLQQLLQFSRPKQVVSSLLNLSPAELAGLCCDKCGSHIVDTFFQSPTIQDSSRFMFLKKLEGLYTNIACNRNGSRCLESIWKGSSLKTKITLAEELCKHQDRLEGDQWGHFLYRNFALFKFSQRRKEWMEIQGANTKRQQLLNDILQGKAKKKKKQRALTNENSEVVHTNPTVKQSNKRSHDDDGFRLIVKEQKLEATQQKMKKARLQDKFMPISPEQRDINQASGDGSSKKKRKRNKEKKRVLRNPGLEISSSVRDSAEGKVFRKIKKKKI